MTNKGIILERNKEQIVIYADQENQQSESDVAQYPVEDGGTISDNSKFSSNNVNITGYIVGKDFNEANRRATSLYDWQRQPTAMITLINGINDSDYLIKSFNKKISDNNKNAIYVDITLVKIRKPVGSFAGMKNSGRVQPSTPPSATYVTVVSGNTYWGWMVRYGTSIQQLRDWNHWPDRFIPIGARARVK
ncbi:MULTISPECIES: phage baseplate protein [Fructobacillus]|uniref:LysM repeat (LysM) n=1 Tax=Fructobacillus tropaeoli TaxID=709323 RepID=A0ABN9YK58_9LACO|nr:MULTISPECIES: LysM peptidoglycan-binding domain-containing protein [Fructobacillus]MCK8627183.1 LysM peptidoglycan-binding domain-containing protein [Fructobacillus cardui]CAK1228267.1 LysM repeat (LysM) [Fructobacillus tropaeoli]CAK1230248.1 LysM repeat (LysM) [Fructobacillus cardui]CAK1235201.1 LysM repeat (LysM) [Fructobacillus tropaeoli]GIC70621.1 peptidoglycan-binding protein LysM [Fructobacillus tropaeoli]